MSQETPPEAPVQKKRWKFWLLLVVVCLLAGLAVVHLHVRERARQELREVLAAQDREGPWRLADLEEARAFVPESINSARLVEQLGELLPADWGAAPYSRWSESPTNEMLSEARTEEFRQELQRRDAPLQLARLLADRDRGRFSIQYARNPFTTNINHVNRARQAASLLQLDALLRAREGDLAAALRACRAMINAGRAIGDEPFSMSQLTRWGAVRMACMTLERVLGQGEWSQQGLAEVEALQRLLAREARHDGYGISLRGERALLHQFFEALETGEASFRDLGADFSKLREVESLYTFLHLHRARQLHAQMFPYFRDLLAVARTPRPQRAARQQAFDARLRQELKADSVLAIYFANLSRLEEGDRRYQASLCCTMAGLAAEQFRRQKGRWPESIAELKGLVASEWLEDPCDGRPLRLLRTAEGLLIYSVGPDGEDHGGRLDPRGEPGSDQGFRLWDVAHRRKTTTR